MIPDPQWIAQKTADYLGGTVTSAPQIREMPWSTLYFMGVDGRAVVVKIVHFPNQTDPQISWQSEELLIRGQREYNSIVTVYQHFAQQDPLCAMQPLGYIRDINAVVTEFVSGVPLYNACATPARLRTSDQRVYAEKMMYRTGQWLRHFHTLPLGDVPEERLFGPTDATRALASEIDHLRQRGITVRLPDIHVETEDRIWTHGDFHMRNVLVLSEDRILGFDTALERVDSPYADLGKCIADLKTRRARILRLGLIPSARTIQRLEDAFLAGYGKPVDRQALALYEARYFFQKWNESLDALDETFYGKTAAAGWMLRRAVINPTFQRLGFLYKFL
jgi:hypothetical protein